MIFVSHLLSFFFAIVVSHLRSTICVKSLLFSHPLSNTPVRPTSTSESTSCLNMNIESTLALNDGRSIPRFGLGVYQAANNGETEAAVYSALNAGYRHIDTAEVSEQTDKSFLYCSLRNIDFTIYWCFFGTYATTLYLLRPSALCTCVSCSRCIETKRMLVKQSSRF